MSLFGMLTERANQAQQQSPAAQTTKFGPQQPSRAVMPSQPSVQNSPHLGGGGMGGQPPSGLAQRMHEAIQQRQAPQQIPPQQQMAQQPVQQPIAQPAQPTPQAGGYSSGVYGQSFDRGFGGSPMQNLQPNSAGNWQPWLNKQF